ncbi:MAG: hypothetical protein MJ166_10990 [Clostridia bacterium]|nr:hypothetical protein [Clostridia bacterium]
MKYSNSTYFPYYYHLNTKQQQLYIQIRDALKRRLPQIDVSPSFGLTFEEGAMVFKYVMYEYPDLFWVSGEINGKTKSDVLIKLAFTYNSLASSYTTNDAKFQKAIQNFLSGIPNKSDFNKELAINDKLVKLIDYIDNPLDQTSYSALVNRKSVCAGYAKAFQLLMNKLGIPCYYVSGKARKAAGSPWGPHAWNIICLDGEFYNVDITWNDSYDKSHKDIVSHVYFNCADAEFKSNHIPDDICKFLPACTGRKYSYTKATGITPELDLVYQNGVTSRTQINTEADFKNLIKRIAAKGKGHYKMSFPSNSSIIYNKSLDFITAVANTPGIYRGSWRYGVSNIDYRNGWYKIEIEIELK